MRSVLGAAFVLSVFGCKRTAPPDNNAERAQRATAEFYSWYRPLADSSEASMRAVRERSSSFSPVLVTALRADSVARATARSEIVGLDRDPFLNAQDPCDRYQPVRTTRQGSRYLVEVLGSGGCAAHDKPDVVVNISVQRDRVVFENFMYSTNPSDDLLSLLQRLSASKG